MGNKEKLLKILNDPILWIETFVNIVDKEGKVVPFKLNMNENLENQLTAIEQALVADGCMMLESTANGLNHFSELWNKVTAGDAPLWKPFFFSWVKDKKMFAKEYLEYRERYKAIYGRLLTKDELTDKERNLLDDGASMDQLMWRRLKISNGSEEKFCQEYPANPIEAFVTTGSNVFSAIKIAERMSSINKTEKKRIPASVDPIIRKHSGNMTVWKLPVKGERYYIGVDTGEGLGNSSDYSVISIPSSIIGQSNIANVSENTTSIIYQLTENKGKQNMNALLKGFAQRWAYMRKLLSLTGVPISDEDFDSLNVTFNIAKPVDTKADMENMKMQYDMGAISRMTIIEQSPYTSDSAQELQRLAAEGRDMGNAESA